MRGISSSYDVWDLMKIVGLLGLHIAFYSGFLLFFQRPISSISILLALVFIWISIHDMLTFEIPDLASLSLLLLGLGMNFSGFASLTAIAAAALFWFSLFWLVSAIAKSILRTDALGFGDVKLMGSIGACLGPILPIYTVLGASVAASFVLTVSNLANWRRVGQDVPVGIAFGPFLCLSAWVTWLQSTIS